MGLRVECGFVLSWESLVLIWVDDPCGVSSLCHDDLDHGVIVRVGFVPGIVSGDDL